MSDESNAKQLRASYIKEKVLSFLDHHKGRCVTVPQMVSDINQQDTVEAENEDVKYHEVHK